MQSFFVSITLFGLMSFDAYQMQEERVNFINFGDLICEGKAASKYTFLNLYYLEQCGRIEGESTSTQLIADSANGEKRVIALHQLALSRYPAGAYFHFESLFLCTSGTLEGKFVYLKEIGLTESYLKKCSSVLGYSFIRLKSLTILVADKLEINIFLHFGGAFEPFKEMATTICSGSGYIV